MGSFFKITDNIDIDALKNNLINHPELFGQYGQRKYADKSPHNGMTDIWVRYNDINPYIEKGSMEGFNDEHESSWYPVINDLPEIVPIVFDIMKLMKGERLGGVLITKLPAGEKIDRHEDHSWHAHYYEKIYVPIQNENGAKFCFDDGEINPEVGEAYWFNNNVPHWVINDSSIDRIAMIICIKTMEKFR